MCLEFSRVLFRSTLVAIIEDMINQINEENVIVTDTANSFKAIEESTKRITSDSKSLSEYVRDLTEANREITNGVQTMSAISEEIAASSHQNFETCVYNSEVTKDVQEQMNALNELTKKLV